MDGVAFLEVQPLDFRDDVRIDIDLDLGVDFAGRGDHGLDFSRLHRLCVDFFGFRAAGAHARKNDNGQDDDCAGDDERALHPRSARIAGPISFTRVTMTHKLMTIAADFDLENFDT